MLVEEGHLSETLVARMAYELLRAYAEANSPNRFPSWGYTPPDVSKLFTVLSNRMLDPDLPPATEGELRELMSAHKGVSVNPLLPPVGPLDPLEVFQAVVSSLL